MAAGHHGRIGPLLPADEERLTPAVSPRPDRPLPARRLTFAGLPPAVPDPNAPLIVRVVPGLR